MGSAVTKFDVYPTDLLGVVASAREWKIECVKEPSYGTIGPDGTWKDTLVSSSARINTVYGPDGEPLPRSLWKPVIDRAYSDLY